jgi:ubiquinone/menaquinone biosynthesis C-methylase UbiE
MQSAQLGVTMTDQVARHYGRGGGLLDAIFGSLRESGMDPGDVATQDLAPIDEFHIRGREATLELAERMRLAESSRVLDIGSGLGGPARTLAEVYGCHVTGIDVTPEYCETARVLSESVGLGERVEFNQGDATELPFPDAAFDAAMTIHAAMNIAEKDRMYDEARRVLKPGSVFAVYDVLQGEGGDVCYPVPWAREPSISHVATTSETRDLLEAAGFRVVDQHDSSEAGLAWFEAMMRRMAEQGPPPLTPQVLLGEDFPEMARNQMRNLAERRIRAVSFVCEA